MPVSIVTVLSGYDLNTDSGSRSRYARIELTIDELDGWTNPGGAFAAPTTISWTSNDLADSVSR